MSAGASGDESRQAPVGCRAFLPPGAAWRQSWTNLASSGRYLFLFSNRNGPVPSALMPASMWQLVHRIHRGNGLTGTPTRFASVSSGSVVSFPGGGWREVAVLAGRGSVGPVAQSRFGQLEVGGLPVVPVVQPLHHHGEVGQVDNGADTIGVQQGIGALAADPAQVLVGGSSRGRGVHRLGSPSAAGTGCAVSSPASSAGSVSSSSSSSTAGPGPWPKAQPGRSATSGAAKVSAGLSRVQPLAATTPLTMCPTGRRRSPEVGRGRSVTRVGQSADLEALASSVPVVEQGAARGLDFSPPASVAEHIAGAFGDPLDGGVDIGIRHRHRLCAGFALPVTACVAQGGDEDRRQPTVEGAIGERRYRQGFRRGRRRFRGSG